MVEANSTYKQGRFETKLVASVCEMSNVKALLQKMARWLAWHDSLQRSV